MATSSGPFSSSLLHLLAAVLAVFSSWVLAEPGELQHHSLEANHPPRQLPWHAPGVPHGPTAPRRLLAGHPHRSLLASPGGPALRFQLLHRPSGGQPPALVNFTVTAGAPVPGGKDLPLLFLLNGGNVEAEQYSQLASHLASRGYTFVGSNLYQPLPPFLAAAFASSKRVPRGNCPSGRFLAASASLIPTFLEWARNSSLPAVKDISRRGIVLVSHSMGGLLALNLLTGGCARSPPDLGVDFCGSHWQQPGARNVSASSATCTANRTQQQLDKDLLLGVVVWEGYISNRSAAGRTSVLPMGIPAGTFVLFMASQYNNNTRTAYNLTTAPRCSCAGLAQFPGLSHFGINDWQGPGTHQVTPCAMPGQSDPANFTVTEQMQREALLLQAQLIDDFVRAAAMRQRLSQQRLKAQAVKRVVWQPSGSSSSTSSNSIVISAAASRIGPQQHAAYDLHLSSSCF